MRTLVLHVGGIEGAFTAGALAELEERGFGRDQFDAIVGSSVGACSGAYFLAGQIDAGLRIWRELLPGKYMKLRTHDNSYLERVFRDHAALDVAALRSARQRIYATICDPANGETRYECLNERDDPVAAMIAAVTMPFFTQPAQLDGKTVFDGGITAPIPLRFAESLGSSETWMILNQPAGFRRSPWQWRLAADLHWLIARDSRMRRMLIERPLAENEILEELERRDDIVVIRPEKALPVSWRSDDGAAIERAIALGREAAAKTLERLPISAPAEARRHDFFSPEPAPSEA